MLLLQYCQYGNCRAVKTKGEKAASAVLDGAWPKPMRASDEKSIRRILVTSVVS